MAEYASGLMEKDGPSARTESHGSCTTAEEFQKACKSSTDAIFPPASTPSTSSSEQSSTISATGEQKGMSAALKSDALSDAPHNFRVYPAISLSDIAGQSQPLSPVSDRYRQASSSDFRPHEITPDKTTLYPLLDSDLRPIPNPSFSQRVMARLWQSHVREPRQEFADDYRIAWITVYLASMHSGLPSDVDPWKSAFYQYIGDAPEKLIPFFMARAYADQNFPTKYLPFRYAKGWREDFAYWCRLLNLPVPSLIPEFLARPRIWLVPKKPQPIQFSPENKKEIA